MALPNGIRVIWLDTHIGRDEDYQDFKSRFETTLESATAIPPNEINRLILALEQNEVPVLFAHSYARAATLIEEHHDKQIIFVSSGSLGQHMIPFITAVYPHVYRFYIFCGKVQNYVEFGLDYVSCLQMFDHETDLLVRLARDISGDLINEGEIYLANNRGLSALICFEHSVTLNTNANDIDKPNGICTTYLKKLNGDGNNVGLIQRAQEMRDQQQS